ncbi:hypothetical protein KOI40_05135 [Aestuariicella sp. G3-2]|uniref:hypothetical protein n=1 Tax=Pseudomaricurvus albidus TaxID=2842452 RepID=UPI001C0BD301|nr:hypothetical protein [Aestuariicella albida]MBU3069194.1 hypothetical protein [Aestuariicella albida]
MNTKLKISMTLNLIVAAVSLLVGVLYLAATELTDYHKAVIGVDIDSIAPGAKLLLFILMKGTGDAVLITGISILFITLVPLKKGENWARWAILTIGLTCYIPMFGGAAYLASTTGAPSPWWLNFLLIALLFVGFFLSGPKNINNK